MLKKVENYIEKNNLLCSDAKVIVGVSGGADSVALLHILKQLGYSCIVAHCNFHLRDEESDNDEIFVREMANELHLAFEQIDFDTMEYARKCKISVEMAARELRYNWFEQLRKTHNASAIAVAHHADDNVETLLMNLTRGTGLKGMTGIPLQNGYVIRPLLCCTRADIVNYLIKYNLHHITDSTNAQNDYTRNKFRNQIIPLFEEINPSFKQTITALIERFEEIETVYNEKMVEASSIITSTENNYFKIDIQKLKRTKYSKSLLYEILLPYSFHADTVENIINNLESEPGAIFYSITHKLLHDRDFLIVSKNKTPLQQTYNISESATEIFEPIHLYIRKRTYDSKISKSNFFATLDATKVSFPLILRRWQKADSFVPFGMKNSKKLSDFFIDMKMNRFEKENTWLLCSGIDIVWVVGHRIDNRFCVDSNTQDIIEIQLIDNQ
ncbi:MAG: tRNA lysidine(34) synthetase TilS [Paludibacter sp.]